MIIIFMFHIIIKYIYHYNTYAISLHGITMHI